MKWRLGYQPGLDGLRGLAVLFVLGVHLQTAWFPAWGSVGVGLFFVLSGFLITAMLLEEHDATARIDLLAFYRRRARRLLPAFAVVILVVGVASASIGHPTRYVVLAALYVSNWVQVGGGHMGLFTHTWSLAVEEQFYLLWPVAVAALLRRGSRRLVAATAALGASAALIARFAEWGGRHGISDLIRVSFHVNAAGLLVGCLLAACLVNRPVPVGTRPSAATAALVGAALVGALGPRLGYAVLAAPAAYLAGALAIWWLVRGGSGGWLASAPLRFCGRRSYSWYLWHPPVMGLVGKFYGSVEARCLALGLALCIAEVSYRWIEKPWRLRSPRQPAQAGQTRADAPLPLPARAASM